MSFCAVDQGMLPDGPWNLTSSIGTLRLRMSNSKRIVAGIWTRTDQDLGALSTLSVASIPDRGTPPSGSPTVEALPERRKDCSLVRAYLTAQTRMEKFHPRQDLP